MSVFQDEWRACLREQYKSAIRKSDRVTLPSLTAVMQQLGFGEDELVQLRIEATMRADEMPDDFVPDFDISPIPATDFQAHPLECQCPSCVQINLVPHNEEGQPLSEEEQLEHYERQQAEDDENNPQQLSMF